MKPFTSLETIIKEYKTQTSLLSASDCHSSRICSTIRNMYEQRAEIEKHERDQLAVGTYFTKNFEESPKAQLLYSKLPKNTDPVSAEKSAILHDKLFALEKESRAKESSSKQDIEAAKNYYSQIMDYAKKMNLEKEHSYLKTNLNNITKFENKIPDVPIANTDDEVEKLKAKTTTSPPFERHPDPKKDMDLDSKTFLIRRGGKIRTKLIKIDDD
jgi:hypothetical protein